LVKPNQEISPTSVFNQFWSDINNKFVFFDYKNVSWDSIKQVYEPLISDEMNENELFSVLSSMVVSLKDGHTSLYTPFDTCKYYFYEGVPNNFNSEFVKNTYLVPNNFQETETIRHCLLNNNVAYLHYGSFEDDVTEEGINSVLENYTNSNGLIIDIRDNTGGDLTNIYRLVEHFVENERLCGYFQEKLNEEHNSLTEPYPIYVSSRGVSFSNKSIIVLTNRKVYSSAHIFTCFMSQLPNVKIIGDMTGGGSGVPTSNQLSNGWLFRYSSGIVTFENRKSYESGLNPDINVSTGSESELLGKDLLIERAILELQ
jgi:hypothetical protein